MHVLVMAAFPVNLIAGRTNVEFVIIKTGERFETGQHNLFADRFQQMVTAQAALEGQYPSLHREALYNLDELPLRIQVSYTISAQDGIAH